MHAWRDFKTLPGLTPNYKQSTSIPKYYIEKYYYIGSILYIYIDTHIHSLTIYVFIHIPGCLVQFPNDSVPSTENVCLH